MWLDLFSRRVVGWSMRAAMTAQLVTDALVMAIWRRGKPDLRRKWLRRRAAGYDKSSAAERTNFPSEVVEMLAHVWWGTRSRPHIVAAIDAA
jgi:transposase InsO family protein